MHACSGCVSATCVSPACAQLKRKNTKTKGPQWFDSISSIKIITQTQNKIETNQLTEDKKNWKTAAYKSIYVHP